jgi:hypothetical protein
LVLKQRDICNRVQGKLMRRRGTHALGRGLADNSGVARSPQHRAACRIDAKSASPASTSWRTR